MDDIPTHVVATAVYITNNDGAVLLAQRSAQDDQAAGDWSVPGGKVDIAPDTDDILEQTVAREVREEVGVEITDIRYALSRSFVRSSGHHVIWLIFTARYLSGEARPLEDQDAVAWVPVNQLQNYLPKYAHAELAKIMPLVET